jgi:Tfp pilus assembly protein PilO
MNKKPALIAALVGVGLVLVMMLGLIAPKASQVKSKEKDIDEAAQKQTTLQLQLDQLTAWALDAPKDRKRLAKLETQIPPQADLPGLIRLLNNTADKSAVDFAAIAPGSPSLAGEISAIPIQVTIKGTFFAVDQYLYLLENLARVSKVTNLTVTPLDATVSPPTLQVALTANFYTTDPSSGPGAVPTTGQQAPPAVAPTPVPSPTEA